MGSGVNRMNWQDVKKVPTEAVGQSTNRAILSSTSGLASASQVVDGTNVQVASTGIHLTASPRIMRRWVARPASKLAWKMK